MDCLKLDDVADYGGGLHALFKTLGGGSYPSYTFSHAMHSTIANFILTCARTLVTEPIYTRTHARTHARAHTHISKGNAPDTSKMNPNCTSGFVGAAPDGPPRPPAVVHIDVDVSSPAVSRTSGHFVSWNIDASRNRGFFWRNIDPRLPYGKQLASQAAAISAANTDGYVTTLSPPLT